MEEMSQTHFKEHLHLQRREAVALLDPRVSLEEGSGRHPTTDPLNGDHFTVGGDERRV